MLLLLESLLLTVNKCLPLALRLNEKDTNIGSVYIHAFKRMYLINEISYGYMVWTTLLYVTLCVIPKLYPTTIAQLSMTQGEFVFERNFCCFQDDKCVETTCHKENTE